MKNVAAARKELGVRTGSANVWRLVLRARCDAKRSEAMPGTDAAYHSTRAVFNLLGPLTNPAKPGTLRLFR